MDALVKREPSGLPAVPSAVFAENGQRLAPGDGEAGVPTILVVRVKVVRRRIEEVETLVIRIVRELIGPVESVLHQVPYGMGSGWSTWEQAMSSAPRVP